MTLGARNEPQLGMAVSTGSSWPKKEDVIQRRWGPSELGAGTKSEHGENWEGRVCVEWDWTNKGQIKAVCKFTPGMVVHSILEAKSRAQRSGTLGLFPQMRRCPGWGPQGVRNFLCIHKP